MLKKQLGLTMISWVLVIGLVGIKSVMAMRIIPIYMNYNSVKHIMDSLPDNPEVRKMTKKKLIKYLDKRLTVDGLRNIRYSQDAFKFVNTKTGIMLELKYEDRGPIIGNLEFIAAFSYEVLLPPRQR